MNPPQINDTISGYIFTWLKEKITIEVSRIHPHSDGRVTGEIVITTSAPGYGPHLHQAQFNFSSSRSRTDLAKTLELKYPKLVNWFDVLEQLSAYTLERSRRGEPVNILTTGEDVKPPEYILEPIIIKNYPTILFGDPGTAKSTVAIIMTQIMANPLAWVGCGLDLIPPRDPVETLYLDYEMDEDTVRWMLTKIQRGMGLPPLKLNYRRCALPLAQDVAQIHQHISDTNAKVIIIDSLGLACGGELKEAESALAFFSALRQLKTTSLILAHTAKNPETKKKTVFGSVFFEAQARSIWETRKAQDVGEDEIDLGLFHRKSPPFQKLCQPIGLNIAFTADSMIISPSKPRTIGEFLSALSTQSQIEELLKEGAMTTKEIVEALDITDAAARMALKRLKDKKKITKLDSSKWGLLLKEV